LETPMCFQIFVHDRWFHEEINYIAENEYEGLHWLHVKLHYIDILLYCCWLHHKHTHRDKQVVERWACFIVLFATRNADLVNREVNISRDIFVFNLRTINFI
jgi:hypothetical protein